MTTSTTTTVFGPNLPGDEIACAITARDSSSSGFTSVELSLDVITHISWLMLTDRQTLLLADAFGHAADYLREHIANKTGGETPGE